MPDRPEAPRVHPEDRNEWRSWLLSHHQSETGVWLVTWRKAAGKPILGYDDAVSEGLCVGWVDSLPKKLDELRTMLYFSPRKPRSAWSRPNKQRVERLRAAGLMTEAGERVIALAEANGAWSMLDDVEDLIEPEDLQAALDATPMARQHWLAFPPSARRGILEWIVQARTEPTRAKRVAETARLGGENQRANQWSRKNRGDVS